MTLTRVVCCQAETPEGLAAEVNAWIEKITAESYGVKSIQYQALPLNYSAMIVYGRGPNRIVAVRGKGDLA